MEGFEVVVTRIQSLPEAKRIISGGSGLDYSSLVEQRTYPKMEGSKRLPTCFTPIIVDPTDYFENCAHLVKVWKTDNFFKKMELKNWKIFRNATDSLAFDSGKPQMINIDDSLDSQQVVHKDIFKWTRGEPVKNDFDIVITEVAPKGVAEPTTRRSRGNARKDAKHTEYTKQRRQRCQKSQDNQCKGCEKEKALTTVRLCSWWLWSGYSESVTKSSGNQANVYQRTFRAKNEDKQSGSFERFTEKDKMVCGEPFVDREKYVDFDKSGNTNNKSKLRGLRMKDPKELELTEQKKNRRAAAGGSRM
ncbi:hypothetical protein POM88_008479 [Heracleum sosnowskyi]|uniref:Uncharacterized protein n=1 Tax=Heracleum sosnowskyi TaxID=360622 RepID=A0AAD8J7G5_9APIA|nr:hypothetical protein POM88_008479 [Heracleum sosnowskyi]